MIKNLTPQEIYALITNDFEDLWNSVASNSSAHGRGNFLFAMLAMEFLEFTCRLCYSDKTGKTLLMFSKELDKIDSRYFNIIEGLHISKEKEFVLPHITNEHTHDLLICALFDLIRNGLAHQYQQILVKMKDEKFLGITLSGPGRGIYLDKVRKAPRTNMNHFRMKQDPKGNYWLTISPARLYLDFKKAFDDSKILNAGLKFKSLMRPDPIYPKKKYEISSDSFTGLLSKTRGGFIK